MTLESALAWSLLAFSVGLTVGALIWVLERVGVVPTRVKTPWGEVELLLRSFLEGAGGGGSPPTFAGRAGGSAPTGSPAIPQGTAPGTAGFGTDSRSRLTYDRLHKAFYGRFERENPSIVLQTQQIRDQVPGLSYQEAWLTVMNAWTPRALLEAIAEVAAPEASDEPRPSGQEPGPSR